MKTTTQLKALKKLRKSLTWETASGEDLIIGDMEKSHVQNVIILLSRKQKECDELKLGDYEINDMTANEWIEIFKDELEYRKEKQK